MLKPEEYNEDKTYFMLSVFDKQSIKWIRAPFLNEIELAQKISLYQENDRYESLEVLCEKTLDEIVSLKNKNGDYQDVTLRSFLFGPLYEENAKSLKCEDKKESRH